MDAILFYGDRDEATRRQVRSAAASHSHRIGPRKPKASRRPRSDSNGAKKRNPEADTPISSKPADMIEPFPNALDVQHATTPSQLPDRSCQSESVSSPAARSSSSATLSRATPTGCTNISPEKALKRQAAQARWEQLQSMQRIQSSQHTNGISQSAAMIDLKPPGQPYHGPPPPPLKTERIEGGPSKTSHSRNSSQNSAASPSTRLPQYSWTEYPRYPVSGLPGSVHTFTPAGTAGNGLDSHVSQLPRPPAPRQDMPGLRPYNLNSIVAMPRSQPRQHLQTGDFSNRAIPEREQSAQWTDRPVKSEPFSTAPG